MGLFGLASFTAEQKTKEIAVSKVLGASVSKIARMLSKEFLTLVGIANVIAWPLVWIIMQKILQNFPYRISIGIKYFLLSGVISMAVAMGTVLFLVIKAAAVNPVECLRHE